MTDLQMLVADLQEERAALAQLVDELDEPSWATPTPAEGYDVLDQIWHLAWYDGAARRAVAQPDEFAVECSEVAADITAYDDRVVRRGRDLSPRSVRESWAQEAAGFDAAALDRGAPSRVNWYMTEMSLKSLVTARIMETWAHGQDVRDTFGRPPEVSDRLRHVARIGCGALPYAFIVRGLPIPADPVRVELVLPSGATFEYGPADAVDRIAGSALDFCLVVTQRRHPDDAVLQVQGGTAEQWLPISQAFAGPPGPGRRSGQFAPDVRSDA